MGAKFARFGARQPEAGQICNVLAQAGLKAPHTGKPYSEALIFGVGGGIGVGYFVFDYGGFISVYLNTRIMTQETKAPDFHVAICRRLGLSPKFINTPKPEVARKKLDRAISGGQAPIVWAFRAGLPYYAARGTDNSYHNVTVYAADDDAYHVADRCRTSLSVGKEQLVQAAMNPMSPKFRALILEPGDETPNLELAVKEGLAVCRRQMLQGWSVGRTQSNTGLNGLEKWGALLTDPRDKKGWPKMFSTGPALYERLVSMYEQIEHRGEKGANRLLYADFLDEAAGILGDKTLHETAAQCRAAAKSWSSVAKALLPDRVEILKKTRKLMDRKNDLFIKKGESALPEMEAINADLLVLDEAVKEEFPLNRASRTDLLGEVSSRIDALRRLEREIFESLSA